MYGDAKNTPEPEPEPGDGTSARGGQLRGSRDTCSTSMSTSTTFHARPAAGSARTQLETRRGVCPASALPRPGVLCRRPKPLPPRRVRGPLHHVPACSPGRLARARRPERASERRPAQSSTVRHRWIMHLMDHQSPCQLEAPSARPVHVSEPLPSLHHHDRMTHARPPGPFCSAREHCVRNQVSCCTTASVALPRRQHAR